MNHTNLDNEIEGDTKFPIGTWIAWFIIGAIMVISIIIASKKDKVTFQDYNPQDVAKVVCDSGICL